MKIPLNRQNKIAVLQWLRQGYIETKDIPEVKNADTEEMVINVEYTTDEDLRQGYIGVLRGRGLTDEQLADELESLRQAVRQ